MECPAAALASAVRNQASIRTEGMREDNLGGSIGRSETAPIWNFKHWAGATVHCKDTNSEDEAEASCFEDNPQIPNAFDWPKLTSVPSMRVLHPTLSMMYRIRWRLSYLDPVGIAQVSASPIPWCQAPICLITLYAEQTYRPEFF